MRSESPFEARIIKSWTGIPIRAYVFKNGFQEGFSGEVDSAADHLFEACEKIQEKSFDYLLAAVWFNPKNKSRTIDFMGYSGVKENWEANPEIDPFIFRNGVYLPREEKRLEDIVPGEKSFCGTMMRVLGKEEEYRLETPSLKTYFWDNPDLGDMEPRVDALY